MKTIFLLVLTALTTFSCSKSEKNTNLSETDQWKLGWRMILNSQNKDHQLAEAQFDSLLAVNSNIEYKFLITGLKSLHALGKRDKIITILQNQETNKLSEICADDLFTKEVKDVKQCDNITTQEVLYPELRLELVKMFVDDQAARGNLMEELIEKYDINKGDIKEEGGLTVDGINRYRLKEIFIEYGFPTREMVGKDAMQGIFLMIQHADGDIEWQKGQLSNIEMAVERGDMDGQSYAYLYDRIQINNGKKQLYGTQFADVDPINRTVTLAETDNMDSLDHRRMAVGMMPIEMYKEYMLSNLQN